MMSFIIGYEDIDQGYKIDSFLSFIAWIIVAWKKISGSFQQGVNSLLPTHNMFLRNVLLQQKNWKIDIYMYYCAEDLVQSAVRVIF